MVREDTNQGQRMVREDTNQGQSWKGIIEVEAGFENYMVEMNLQLLSPWFVSPRTIFVS